MLLIWAMIRDDKCGIHIDSQLSSLYTSEDTDSCTKPRILDSQAEYLLLVGLIASRRLLNCFKSIECEIYVLRLCLVKRKRSSQRPQKSELSGWQLSARKNFPGEVRKSFSRQKNA